MDNTPDTCLMARTFGQNWRTTTGQLCAAVGGVLCFSVAAGTWHTLGLVLFAVGGVFAGINGRDAQVSSAQMDAAGSSAPIPLIKPPTVLLIACFACGWWVMGCICHGPLTVSVFSSRMTIASTNVTQIIDGGAAVIPSIGLGDSAISNVATTAKDAMETTSGIKAGTAVAGGAAALLGARQ